MTSATHLPGHQPWPMTAANKNADVESTLPKKNIIQNTVGPAVWWRWKRTASEVDKKLEMETAIGSTNILSGGV